MFKYICKENDRTVAELSHQLKLNKNKKNQSQEINEIKVYLDCKYITLHEAIWRLFQYYIHCNVSSIEKLPIHLPKMNNIVFTDGQDMRDIINCGNFDKTMLT